MLKQLNTCAVKNVFYYYFLKYSLVVPDKPISLCEFFLPTVFLVLFTVAAYSSNRTDSLLAVLKIELAKKNIYDGRKEASLKKLKTALAATGKNKL